MTSLQTPPQSVPTPEPSSAKTADKSKPDEASPPTFDVLPLSHDVRVTLAEMGYVHPTPVQIAVFEPAKRGKDLVVQARTGTGKTAAFGLPIVDHIVKRSIDKVQVLALTPTRELALQVGAEVERLGKRRGVRVTSIYGGAPMQKQIDAIAAGAQVICGTPGRVLDHLRRGTLDPRSIRLVVLDESDEMLSMGFERELNAILEYLPSDRQTLLFSATLPPDIERIARNKLKSPEFVTLSGDHVGALSIHHYVYMVSSDKITALLRVIEVENPESAIVFCNTRDETERVSGALVRQGFEADWLNGDLDQGDREKVMAATREGRIRFLVATDVAARGIDISHLTHVINFDFPQDAESYVHRTGRTGRAGRTGSAVSLVTPQDIGQLYLLRLTYKIRPIEKQVPSDSELKTRAEADLVMMFAEAYSKKAVHPDDMSLARRLLTHDSAEVILAGLLRDHLGARPTAKEEASANRRAAKPKPAEAPPPPRNVVSSSPGGSPREAPAPNKAPAKAPEAVKQVVAPAAVIAPVVAPAAVIAPVVAPIAPVVAPIAPTAPVVAPAPVAVVQAAVPPVHEAAPVEDVVAPVSERENAVTIPLRAVTVVRPDASVPVGAEAALLAEDTTEPLPVMDPQGDAIAAPSAATPVSGVEASPVPGSEARPIEGRYGRRDDRRNDRRRGRERDGRPPRDLADRNAPRPNFSDAARERAAADRPLDRARPVAEGKAFVRHADFANWQPPEEEGDDEPIWGDSRRGPPPGGPGQPPVGEHRPHAAHPHVPGWSADGELRSPGNEAPAEPLAPGETVELHVSIGRRDGARASDLVRVLEKAGLSKESVQRVRVRERHAFLTVRKDDEERALAALTSAPIAGRSVTAERARERTPFPEGGGTPDQGGGEEPQS